MRPKVVVAILLLAVGLLGLVALMSKALRPPSVVSPADRGNVAPVAVVSNSPVTAHVTVPANPVAVPATNLQQAVSTAPVADTNAAAAHAQYVRQRIKELNALAMNNDTESRDIILSEVKNNPDRQIRAAALEAAIQFDDRSVVQQLQQIADQTQDPEEKQSILDAIDYINLPSLTEYLAANPSQSTAPGARKIPPRPTTHAQQPPQASQSAASGQ
jgi:hypothetical protein